MNQNNKIVYSFIKILTGSDLSKRRVPYMLIKSPENGPVLWLTACMHGDEIGGSVIIHELFKKLKNDLKCGSVYAFPLMNPFGFEAVSRSIVYTKEDLNRSFPGNEKGTLAQRIAARIFTFITDTCPTLVLDLHNDWNKSIPYVLIDPLTESSVKDSINSYSSATSLLQIKDTENIRSSLTYNLIQKNINALTLEFGESYIINEKNIKVGIKAIWNILMDLNMVEPAEPVFQYPLHEDIQGKKLTYSSLPYSSGSGIIRFLKNPGDLVKKGEKIARIYNAFGKLTETIIAVDNGVVIGLTDNAIAFPGSPIMAFGIF